MTNPDQDKLSYRTVDGNDIDAVITLLGDADSSPRCLRSRSVELTGTSGQPESIRALQLLVDQAWAGNEPPDQGYLRLDNEILAGLRVSRRVRSRAYPIELSRLIGYAPDSPDPCALLEPYRGEIAGEVAGHLVQASQIQFQVSVLVGIRWLAAAGISHGGIGPATVRWDGNRAQITDFSLATLLGTPRPAGPRSSSGPAAPASEGDDVLAAGLLMYYVVAGEELTGPDKLNERPSLRTLLDGVFDANPDQRPTAAKLLERLEVADPVPRGQVPDPLVDGRADFEARRRQKHPNLVGPPASAAAEPEPPTRPDGHDDQPRRRRWLGSR